MMEIQRKGEQWRQVIGVGSGHVDGMFGWIKKHDDRTVFYPSTHWEPVEEWVKIEVPQHQIRKFYYMRDYVTGTFLKWRYPQ